MPGIRIGQVSAQGAHRAYPYVADIGEHFAQLGFMSGYSFFTQQLSVGGQRTDRQCSVRIPFNTTQFINACQRDN